MPIILPDARKKGTSVVEIGKAYSQKSKQDYADSDMEGMRKEAAMVTAKYLIQAVQSGDTEEFVKAFKQMLELCES